MTDNYTTTNAGAPAPSDELSLSLGPDGPILLQDSYLIEQMAAFIGSGCPSVSRMPKGLVHSATSK
jgi:catalase